RPDVARKVEVVVERVALDVELGGGIRAQQRRKVVNVLRPDVSLVGPRMHGDAMGTGVQRQPRGVNDAGDVEGPRVPQRRYLIDVDAQLGHVLSPDNRSTFSVSQLTTARAAVSTRRRRGPRSTTIQPAAWA